jgi:hypothetical protein
MHAFAFERAADVTLGRIQRRAHARLAAALAARGEQPGLEAMTHDEARIDGQCLVDGRHRIGAVERELHDGAVVQIQRGAVARRNEVAKLVSEIHEILRVLSSEGVTRRGTLFRGLQVG